MIKSKCTGIYLLLFPVFVCTEQQHTHSHRNHTEYLRYLCIKVEPLRKISMFKIANGCNLYSKALPNRAFEGSCRLQRLRMDKVKVCKKLGPTTTWR